MPWLALLLADSWAQIGALVRGVKGEKEEEAVYSYYTRTKYFPLLSKKVIDAKFTCTEKCFDMEILQKVVDQA